MAEPYTVGFTEPTPERIAFTKCISVAERIPLAERIPFPERQPVSEPDPRLGRLGWRWALLQHLFRPRSPLAWDHRADERSAPHLFQ
jgi:hypothetical protein